MWNRTLLTIKNDQRNRHEEARPEVTRGVASHADLIQSLKIQIGLKIPAKTFTKLNEPILKFQGRATRMQLGKIMKVNFVTLQCLCSDVTVQPHNKTLFHNHLKIKLKL